MLRSIKLARTINLKRSFCQKNTWGLDSLKSATQTINNTCNNALDQSFKTSMSQVSDLINRTEQELRTGSLRGTFEISAHITVGPIGVGISKSIYIEPITAKE